VEITAVIRPSTIEVRKARMIASFSHSTSNQRKSMSPVIGKLPNWLALNDNSTTTATGRNMNM
jgi:hypothetical protein